VDVERCSPDAALFESGTKRLVINKTSSGRVYEEGAWPHLLDGVLIYQVVIVLVQGAVQRHAVRLEQQVLKHKFAHLLQELSWKILSFKFVATEIINLIK
jgi:hypothetical protein